MGGKPAKLTKTIGLFLVQHDGCMSIARQADALGLTPTTVSKFRKIIHRATRGAQCYRKYDPFPKVLQPSDSEINQWFK